MTFFHFPLSSLVQTYWFPLFAIPHQVISLCWTHTPSWFEISVTSPKLSGSYNAYCVNDQAKQVNKNSQPDAFVPHAWDQDQYRESKSYAYGVNSRSELNWTTIKDRHHVYSFVAKSTSLYILWIHSVWYYTN